MKNLNDGTYTPNRSSKKNKYAYYPQKAPWRKKTPEQEASQTGIKSNNGGFFGRRNHTNNKHGRGNSRNRSLVSPQAPDTVNYNLP